MSRIIKRGNYEMEKIETFEEFLKLCDRTVNTELSDAEKVFNGRLGFQAELGEFCDIIKKHLHQGHEIDLDELKLEAFDTMWYLAEIINYYENISVEEITFDHRTLEIMRYCNVDHYKMDIKSLVEEVDKYRYKICKLIIKNKSDDIKFDNLLKSYMSALMAIIEEFSDDYVDFSEIMTHGILKLKNRFPDKFDSELSVNRNVDSE